MANGLQSFMGVPDPFDAGDLSVPNPFQTKPIEEQNLSEGLYTPGQTFEQNLNDDLKQQLLNPTDEVSSLISSQSRALMRREDATPEEKEASFADTIAAMVLMNTYDTPTQKDILNSYKSQLIDEFGIDLDQYKDINRSGDPYLAAGDTLIEASRAGYTAAQSIGKALSAFNASSKVSQLPDPAYVNLALGLLERSGTEAAAYSKARGTGSTTYNDYVITKDGKSEITPLNANEVAVAKMAFDLEKAGEGAKKKTKYKYLGPKGTKVIERSFRPHEYEEFIKNNPNTPLREVTTDWNDTFYALNKDGGLISGNMDDILMAGPETKLLANTSLTKMFDKERQQDDMIPYDLIMEDKKKEVGQRRYTATSTSPMTISIGENGTQITQGGNLSTRGTFDLSSQQKQNNRIATLLAPQIKNLNERTEIAKELTGIITMMKPLIDGGGTAERLISKGTGIINAASSLVDQLGFGDNDKTQFSTDDGSVGYSDMYRQYLDGVGEFGGQYSLQNIRKSSFYGELSRAGLEQDRLDKLIFHLAIAGARSKGEGGKSLSDKDLALWLKGFGGNAMTSDRFKSTLYTTGTMLLNQYDDNLRAIPRSVGVTDIFYQGYGKAPSGEDVPEIQSKSVNPWVEKGYMTENPDGRYNGFDIDASKLNIFDTTDTLAEYKTALDSLDGVVISSSSGVPVQTMTIDGNLEKINTFVESNQDSSATNALGESFGDILKEFKVSEFNAVKTLADQSNIDLTSPEFRALGNRVRKRLLDELREKKFKDDNENMSSWILYMRKMK